MRQRTLIRYPGAQVRDAMAELRATLILPNEAAFAAIESVLEREINFARELAHEEGICVGMRGKIAHAEKDAGEREQQFLDKYAPWRLE